MGSLIKKKDLELLLQRLNPHPKPKVWLEQYTIPAETAAEILFIAGFQYGDIEGKRVTDLGCGTGRLALGAAVLGAAEVYGVDIDQEAVRVAYWNQKQHTIGMNVNWIVSDIDCLKGHFDTVIQNPPFGVKRRGADRVFLEKALDIASVVYSMHKYNPKNIGFIKKTVEREGGIITDLFRLDLRIQWTFNFHRKKSHMIKVDLYRMEKH